MRRGHKTAEVRKYRPEKIFLRRQPEVTVGMRICLVGRGEVWGSAIIDGVREYDPVSLETDGRHCLGHDEKTFTDARKRVANGEDLYAWDLSSFLWHNDAHRPKSGEGVPEFKGQKHGQVWASQLIPCDLNE